MEQPSTSTQDPFQSNHSIDRVVSQIERMGGQMNDLVLSSKLHIDGMISHGTNTVNRFTTHFSGLTEEFDGLMTALDSKFGGFPLTALYILLAISLVLLIVFLLYMMTAGSERISNRYNRLRVKKQQPKGITTSNA